MNLEPISNPTPNRFRRVHSTKPCVFPALLLGIILFSAMLLPASVRGQTYTPGVIAGNWGTFTTSGNSTSFRNVTLLNITVTRVAVTNVTLDRTAFFKNGSHIVATGWIDVKNGTTSSPPNNFTFLLSAKDLSVGDAVYVGQPFIVNRTQPATVAGVTRSVNVLQGQEHNYVQWDRLTGFLVGFNISIADSYLMAVMQKTNVWSAVIRTPTDPIQLLTAIFLVMVASILYRTRRNERVMASVTLN